MKINIPENNTLSTVSNILYPLIGGFLFMLNGMTYLPYFLVMVYLGIGSAYYHYYERHEYVWYDWSAMYFVFSIQIATYINVLMDPSIGMWVRFGVFAAGFLIASILSLYHRKLEKHKITKQFDFAFLTIGVLYTTTAAMSFFTVSYIAAVISILLFGIGFFIRQTGEQKMWKPNRTFRDEELHDRMHAMWHVYTAIAMFLQNLI